MEKILRTYDSKNEVSPDNLSINLFLRSKEELQKHAQEVTSNINDALKKNYNFKVINTKVEAGSGSLPVEKINSLAITISSSSISSNKIATKLRSADIPVFNYVRNDLVYIDLKAIPDDQIDILIEQLNTCL
jgi:L-seryl-tRNA(Ser) seleniumtransferase